MKILMYPLCILIGYALGNIQTAILISNGLFKDDVRLHGSRNAGTNNMLRVFGKRAGAFTFVGDCLKGVLA
ncbi:MAG: glycerol-3-phosphate acyltransferase, partial [Eubacteriales bacterium]|nr:glycerol-3-phosphate acyltransferase [Eubacteriales bacterium]